jgi:hypothetical protein
MWVTFEICALSMILMIGYLIVAILCDRLRTGARELKKTTTKEDMNENRRRPSELCMNVMLGTGVSASIFNSILTCTPYLIS